jgi:hypothetical protein
MVDLSYRPTMAGLPARRVLGLTNMPDPRTINLKASIYDKQPHRELAAIEQAIRRQRRERRLTKD